MPKTTLEGLLPQELKKDLTPAEEILLDKAQKGEPADFRSGDKETDKPENADNWGDDRRIRANLLYWLCVDREASELVHAKGVVIHGAQVEGQLDFDAATLPHRLGCLGNDWVFGGWAPNEVHPTRFPRSDWRSPEPRAARDRPAWKDDRLHPF